MNQRRTAILLLAVSVGTMALAKDKVKSNIPAFVLRARTVSVIIDPDAGMTLTDPNANQVARKDVEAALQNWGRFQPVIGTQGADLIVVVRRGHARLVEPTVSNPRQGNRTGNVNPSDDGTIIGVQHGRQPSLSASSNDENPEQTPHPKTEIGGTEDSFMVYEGNIETPLDTRPVWRFVAKDGLRPHNVPAVEAFRKAIAEADKAEADRAAAKKP